jgi:hypothetical protein
MWPAGTAWSPNRGMTASEHDGAGYQAGQGPSYPAPPVTLAAAERGPRRDAGTGDNQQGGLWLSPVARLRPNRPSATRWAMDKLDLHV